MKTIQSYLTTILSGKLTTYEVRVLMKIVQRYQKTIGANHIAVMKRETIPIDALNEEVQFDARDLLKEHSHHYSLLETSLLHLQKKVVSMYDNETKLWLSAALVTAAEVNHETGRVRISVAPWLVHLILNFSLGYSSYDIAKALELKNPNTVRLYMLTSNLKHPYTLSLDYLRLWLGVGEKQYRQNADFIKRCILPAAKDLEKQNMNGFDVRIVKEGRKINGITFVPVKREPETTNQVLAKAPLSVFVNKQLRRILYEECGFSREEAERNKKTITAFGSMPDWDKQITHIITIARKQRAGKGYIIQSMKNAIKKG